MTAVFVQLDDKSEPVPLADLAWECVAPCGCTSGVMVAETVDREAAWREFTPNAERRRRDEAEGCVFRLAPRDEVIDRLRKECECTPKFGRQRVPVPDGYRWAEARGQKRAHLVQVDPGEPKNFRMVWAKHVHGGQFQYWEKVWDVPTCRTCERWATKQAEVKA